ncbi:NAD dependent epimerase/dehydratase [Fictibacillus macauensis ZFHKF-1]|uniref:NAD dependent epimerase/dehydratase n=1 Tax=Fictibacillus macauensis ZFHKF-1 TaxID=1196324 RepID=I8AMB4_9BACL|nr:NAD(P)H-binding protein [Fictibacillus macauensis]EIT86819.1 NAD dependent epimerase/dehydratase [Fictibacillus macauensis ZFHKF-1]
MGKKAVLAGATGLVGRQLVQLLMESTQYDEVVLFSRRETGYQHKKIREIILDFAHLKNYRQEFQGADVFCCLGTTIKKAKSEALFRMVDRTYPAVMAKLAADEGGACFAVISALGAKVNSPFFYNRVKGEMERDVLSDGPEKTGIFRPSLLTGEREEWRLGEKVGEKVLQAFSFVLSGRLSKYRSVSASAVAYSMYGWAQSKETGKKILYPSS